MATTTTSTLIVEWQKSKTKYLPDSSSAGLDEKELWLLDEKRAKFSVHVIHESLAFDYQSVAAVNPRFLPVRQDDDDGRVGELMFGIL